MNPLNDDELNSLIEQAKSQTPEPGPDLAVRALRAYEANVEKPRGWRRLILRPVLIPWPVGMLAAILMVLIGAAAAREHVVYRNCAVGQPEAGPPSASLFEQFQPVRVIKPRVVRSISR